MSRHKLVCPFRSEALSPGDGGTRPAARGAHTGFSEPWRVSYFGTICGRSSASRGSVGWSVTRSGAGRENVRRRISANFWNCFEISGREITHRLQRSARPRNAPVRCAAGWNGDAWTGFRAREPGTHDHRPECVNSFGSTCEQPRSPSPH